MSPDRIDLHTHSTASDGTQSPADLVRTAAAAGLGTVALTDHDTVSGWASAAGAAEQCGIALVRGIELSTEHEGRSVHLLGYLPDPTHPGLVAELERTVHSRDSRLETMVTRLRAEAGLDITMAQVNAQVPPGATPGRPHIADALVAAGVVPHRDEAFTRWLRNDSPYYVHHYAPNVLDAVHLLRDAGAVPVVAHVFADRGDAPDPALVELLAENGLGGIEVEHRDHDERARTLARELARDLDLIVTGSSDYHGTGKQNQLGENTTTPEMLERIEASATSSTKVIRA